jgi:hypothetical protein
LPKANWWSPAIPIPDPVERTSPVTQLAAFDCIFKNGFDVPSY